MKFARNDIIPSHPLITTIIHNRNTDPETQTTTTQRTGTLNTLVFLSKPHLTTKTLGSLHMFSDLEQKLDIKHY